jgi:hypothetical protein
VSGFQVRTARVCIELPLGATYLGRSAECRVRIEEGLVSRRHARLDVDLENVHVEDLGSVNGTYVNGELLTGRRRLQPGDVLAIGSEEIVLEQLDPQRIRRSGGPRTPAFGVITDRFVRPPPGAYIGSDDDDDDPDRDRDRPADEEPTMIGIATPRPRRSMGLFVADLVEKSISMGKFDEAARLVTVIADSLARMPAAQAADTERVQAFVDLSIKLAQGSGQWVHVDRIFEVAAQRRWPPRDAWCSAVEELARTLRPVRGPGLVAYLHVMDERAAAEPELAARLERLKAAVRRPTT